VLAGAFGLELRLTGTSDCCYFRYISSVLKPEFVSLVLPKKIWQKMSKPGFWLHFQSQNGRSPGSLQTPSAEKQKTPICALLHR
jgi:hypothetical protein